MLEAPGAPTLEITETALMEDHDAARATPAALRRLGLAAAGLAAWSVGRTSR
ncbi:hypothetical protein RHODO2019_13850 [Rhodococcus antarcticus]|uniref:Uncharacterized protein n=1 Tax=Rhodococcus antarcticus TaxID=2987751 RepID=A0ABY6NYM1_9NOCA|nr:hypothetical protein [Rhodococcus antarcticus]UZJ24231.1 hypothetical protein RHODO2019_13850 [Rhodococcus antarcticus]